MPPAAWIPVSCALPVTGTVAIGIDRDGDYHIVANIAGTLHECTSGWRIGGITHWTPVPPPPPPESDQ